MNNKENYFEKLVDEAILALPKKMREVVDNVAFVVEDEARPKKAGEMGIKKNEVLIGLYEGIPKIKRDGGYFGVLPDKITIFKKPIMGLSGGGGEKLRKLVNETVWHEVGHHLGLDDAEIKALETRKR